MKRIVILPALALLLGITSANAQYRTQPRGTSTWY
jgi:hypothetical protein